MPESDVIITDGSVDWSGGVDSQAVPTIQSARNPNGLARNELAWANNCTLRDGGITCRSGFTRLGRVADRTHVFQGKFVYSPLNDGTPYEIWSVSGHIYKVTIDPFTVTDLTAAFPANSPRFNPATALIAEFCQGEEFLVIQAGDNTTLPFIWDGATLRRSNGITGVVGPQPTVYVITPTTPWIVPAAGASTTFLVDTKYPGALNDIGVYKNNISTVDLGTFKVTAFAAVAPFSITVQTQSTDFAGRTVLAGFAATFTVGSTVSPVNSNEIPAGGPMDYFMGRIWFAQGRNILAGDIVYGPSGTAAYSFRDAILKVTENPAVIGGDGFSIPSSDGNTIRGIKHSANIDASLGLGRLFVGTALAIYALNVPVTRDDWIAATNSNQPLMTVVQLANGWVSGRSVTPVNGDLYFQSLEPGIRSLLQAIRYFNQPGNIQISSNEIRILQFNDRALMRPSSGAYYDNRMLQTSLPINTDQGICSQALIPLDFVPISSFNSQKSPNWEGMYEGVDIFQLATADFGGRQRCFMAVRSRLDSSLELWEYIAGTRFDYGPNGEARITFVVEFPAFTWGNEMELKRLEAAEIWIDRLYGNVNFNLQYRPDGSSCWLDWHQWVRCSPQNTTETVGAPVGYPKIPCRESYFSTMTVPKPPQNICTTTQRPSTIFYQCQPRLMVTGFCRIRGLYLHATKVDRKLYANLQC